MQELEDLMEELSEIEALIEQKQETILEMNREIKHLDNEINLRKGILQMLIATLSEAALDMQTLTDTIDEF